MIAEARFCCIAHFSMPGQGDAVPVAITVIQIDPSHGRTLRVPFVTKVAAKFSFGE